MRSWMVLAWPLLAAVSGCAAGGGSEPRTCALVLATSVPLELTADQAALAIPVSYDGKGIKLIIDTGSQMTMLDEKLLDAGESTFVPADGRGVGGDVYADYARVKQIEIGQLHGSVVLVAGTLHLGATGTGMAGLLGMDILGQYDVDLNLGGGDIRFYRKFGDCGDRTPTNLSGDLYSVDEIVQEDGDKSPYVPVIINGVRLTAVLDTGSDNVSISRSAARRIGLTDAVLAGDPVDEGRGVSGKVFKDHIHRLDQMTLGELTIHNVRVSVLPVTLDNVDMLLGTPLLEKIHFWLSSSRRQLVMEYPARNSPPVAAETQRP